MRRMIVSKKIVIIIALAFSSLMANSQKTAPKKEVWKATGIIVKSYSNAEGKTREISRCCFIFSYKDKRLSIRVTPVEAFNQVAARAGKDWEIMASENKELSLEKDFSQSSQEAGTIELRKLIERSVPTGGYMIIYKIENLKYE
jgi:hypothetical protein